MTQTAEPLNNSELDSNYFNCLEVWYPIFYLEDLNPSKLHTFTLLEKNLVIWWDQPGNSWRVFLDQCPHRLAPLSQGRINEQGALECPYHGWSFSGMGDCLTIPQQPASGKANHSPRSCALSLPTSVHQGLLFVYPGKPENAPHTKVPIVEPLEGDSEKWICLNTFRDLPYDALTLMENVLDSSHIPYTHHRTVGNRANVAPVDLEVIEADKWGFKGFWEEGPRKGTLGSQTTQFIAPGLMWHDLTSKQFGRTMTVVYATPIRKGECRLFARFPFQFNSKLPGIFIKLTPRWYSHMQQNRILEDDQIFLHYQERYLEQKGGSPNFTKAFYLPTKADLFVRQFRSWVNQYQGDFFESQTFGPPWTQEQLLDRYNSHTKHCKSCSNALINIQKLQTFATVLLVVALAAIPWISPWYSSGLIIILAAFWWGLHRLERGLHLGHPVPPRNLS